MSQQDGGNSVSSQGAGCQVMGEQRPALTHPFQSSCYCPFVGLLPWKWVSSPTGLLQGTDDMVPMSRQEVLSLLEQEVLVS